MALFVDLDDDDVEPPQQDGRKPVWNGLPLRPAAAATASASASGGGAAGAAPGDASPPPPKGIEPSEREGDPDDMQQGAQGVPIVENAPNRNPVAEALGCYPVITVVASSIDLNTLDNLSRTCRQIRHALLQYRKVLLMSTMHCSNEHIPVDPEDTMRYRARAGNWWYMEEFGSNTNYYGKSGQCARDLVSECRRCKMVVCRNCAIKPPAPIVLRDRHRRLCLTCTKQPLGRLVKPALPPQTLVHSEVMQQAICRCDSDGVWLCHPCGRHIRNDDVEYKALWKWRFQYGEVLGGLGTGIGEGDRGVICGRESRCLAAREREQETDCDAADAQEAAIQGLLLPQQFDIPANLHNPIAALGHADAVLRRTPSPSLGPGYARHEIEGIGGVVKTKLVQMVKVGACVPEYEDEKAKGEVLGREIQGMVRSWCGWCWRVIPETTSSTTG